MATARKTKQISKGVNASNSLIAAAGVAAIAGAAFYFRNELMALLGFPKTSIAPHVHAKLPIAKDLPTVPDQDGNYDMDGVSFDTDGVIVGSDNHPDNVNEKQIHH
jgi:hypothetical protein